MRRLCLRADGTRGVACPGVPPPVPGPSLFDVHLGSRPAELPRRAVRALVFAGLRVYCFISGAVDQNDARDHGNHPIMQTMHATPWPGATHRHAPHRHTYTDTEDDRADRGRPSGSAPPLRVRRAHARPCSVGPLWATAVMSWRPSDPAVSSSCPSARPRATLGRRRSSPAAHPAARPQP